MSHPPTPRQQPGPQPAGDHPPAQPSVGDERLLTAGEVAELLAVNESWVREQTRQGRIPHIPLGRYTRYRRSAIRAWIAAQERQARGAA
jgi:excisionase family DNA binding protein